MIIYSEKTKQKYDSVEACAAAEEAFDKEQARIAEERNRLEETREARIKEIQDAYKAIEDTQAEYHKKIEEAKHKYNMLVRDYNRDFRKQDGVKTRVVTLTPDEAMANIMSLLFGPDYLVNED